MKRRLSSVVPRCDQGFSLVETVLALLVVSVGVTAVLALVPTAMDQAKKAADETYAAFFADAVFASYQAAAFDTNLTWAEQATYATIAPVTISAGEDVFWEDSNRMRVRPDTEVHTQTFIAASTKGKWGGNWPLPDSWQQYDHAFRYRLQASAVSSRRRSLALEVWPGEFGPLSNAYRFATETFDDGL